jgi:eukaryotic-like serine/threonine-protein kinase
MSRVMLRGSPAESFEPPPNERYQKGDLISDKYRLVRHLGEGGMGSVWVACNVALDVHVALKLIRKDAQNELAAERLLNEARATARLRHAGIVRVFDFGRTEYGDPFIVMELLSGQSLADLITRERRISATYTVQLLLPIADAVAAAHSQGVVHRDLKPDNVFLTESDGRIQPKVVDFGVAKLDTQDRNRRLTQAGAVVGSPDYMSPEQARGDPDIDHRADIWAFSVLLYECVAGQVPFSGLNYNALLRHIIEEPATPFTEYAAGDALLWRIVERGLSKRREERWSDMRELGSMLAEWLLGHGIQEDICGHALRTAWLDGRSPRSRASVELLSHEPTGQGRVGSAQTTLPPVPRANSVPAHAVKPEAPARKPRLASLLMLVIAAAAAAFLVTRWLGRMNAPPDVTALPSAPVAPQAQAVEPAETPASSSEPLAVPAPLAESANATAGKPDGAVSEARASRSARGSGSLRERSAAKERSAEAATSPAPPTSAKIKRPDEEDFGF